MTELSDLVDVELDQSGEITAALMATVDLVDQVERRALTLLAVAVSLDPHELEFLWRSTWPDEDIPNAQTASRLGSSPLVERIGGRLRVVEPLGVLLARDLANRDEAGFSRAHEALTELERRREAALERSDPGGEQLWQTKSLVAYYLMCSSPADASSAFIKSFDEAPLTDRRACRLWLASLSDRYTHISQEPSRISRFFSAFRSYVAGASGVAAVQFGQLIAEANDDRVAAISMHLRALSLERTDPERRRLLEASVQLSGKLDLNENLIMSRNSLVFENLRIGRRRSERSRLQDGLRLAADNDSLADRLSLPVYQTATRYARAVMLIESAGLDSRRLDTVEAEANSLLDDAQSIALSIHDLASWLRAGLARVDLHLRLGLVNDATDDLAAAVDGVVRAQTLPELPVRQFERQVDRLLVAFESDPERAERVQELDARFRRKLRRRS